LQSNEFRTDASAVGADASWTADKYYSFDA